MRHCFIQQPQLMWISPYDLLTIQQHGDKTSFRNSTETFYPKYQIFHQFAFERESVSFYSNINACTCNWLLKCFLHCLPNCYCWITLRFRSLISQFLFNRHTFPFFWTFRPRFYFLHVHHENIIQQMMIIIKAMYQWSLLTYNSV